MSEAVDRAIADYGRVAASLPGAEQAWLRALREGALHSLSRIDFPTPRSEAWKYTNLAPLLAKPFAPRTDAAAAGTGTTVDAFLLGPALPRLVFVDGQCVPSLSKLSGLPAGVTAGSLGERLRGDDPRIAKFLTTHQPAEPQGFAELNTAFMTDGAYVHVAPGVIVDQPLHLLYIARTCAQPQAAYLRNVVFAGTGSRITVIEHYVSAEDAQALTSAVTQCVLEDGAAIDHYQLNEQGEAVYHFAGVHVHQGKDSRYVSHNAHAGGRLARSDLHVVMAGEGGECTLNGLYLGRGRQHIDNFTAIDHQMPRCSSREWYKGVLDGHARGIFNGQVVVRQNAQHTDARQLNHNLLLSDDAEADTRPQLQIYADDVQCSHGATVGQLDRDALFYLRARGIGEAQARRILVTAFAKDVIDRMTVAAVRDRLGRLVAERLAS